jgi:hypothetical protein
LTVGAPVSAENANHKLQHADALQHVMVYFVTIVAEATLLDLTM